MDRAAERDDVQVNFIIPGEARGKGRPRFARRGNFVKTYTDDKTASFENLVKIIARQAMGTTPLFDGPVNLRLSVSVLPPASWSKKKRAAALTGEIRPTSKPDLDNVLKAIADACNEVVWIDDKQIVSVTATKNFGEVAQTEIFVGTA